MSVVKALISSNFEYLIIFFKGAELLDKFKSVVSIYELKNFSLIKSIKKKNKLNDLLFLKSKRFRFKHEKMAEEKVKKKDLVEKLESQIKILLICKALWPLDKSKIEELVIQKESISTQTFSTDDVSKDPIKKLICLHQTENEENVLISLNGDYQMFRWRNNRMNKLVHSSLEPTLDVYTKENIVLLCLVNMKFVLFNSFSFEKIFEIDLFQSNLKVIFFLHL